MPPALAPDSPQPRPAETAAAYGQFCRQVVDVVAPLVGAVKPQAAFFEQLGPPGMAALAEVIQYARQKGLLVILDGKRNDIGSTATAYAQGYSGTPKPWGADALTVSPYLGDDSLQPFIDVAVARAAGVFVLVKTSNPGGRMFQDLVPMAGRSTATWPNMSSGWPARRPGRAAMGRSARWSGQPIRPNCPSCGPRCPTPGSSCPVSAAKGARRPTWPGPSTAGRGAIVNNSRGIIFAYKQAPYAERFGPARWQEAVEAATRDMIEQLRAPTRRPEGRQG